MSGVNVVPSHLNNFEFYLNGVKKPGVVDITLPNLEAKTTTITGAGISGDIDMPVSGHTNNLTVELNFRITDETALELGEVRAYDFEMFGAEEVYDAATGEYKAKSLRVMVRLLPTSVELGKLSPAETMDTKLTGSAIYLKVSVDGVTKVEVDKLNYIYNVNGTDFLAKIRKALGQ
ncbi:MAG: phage major tail tube protein [Selenomonadales bacterium]|nr:phage major tail tube protein [Selenomonadales bacterium]